MVAGRRAANSVTREGELADFAGLRVLVTGSTRGIGHAIAARFAAGGARVAINSRHQSEADEVASEIAGGAVGVAGDLVAEGGPMAVVGAAAETLGGLDVLVNNAGVSLVKPALDVTLAEWRRIHDLDLTAPFLCAQAAGRVMLAAGSGGAIVNIASMAGLSAFPGRIAYATSKAGLVMMTRILALELAPSIRVNAVAPGYVRTDLYAELVTAGKVDVPAILRRTPLNRVAEPEEIAAVVCFLCSRDAAFITGETIAIDGGWLAYGYV